MAFRRNEDFICRNIAGEVILVPTGKAAQQLNGMVSLNETGAFLWECLKDDVTQERLCELLMEEYEVSRETALADIKEFIDKAAAENMVLEIPA